MQLGNVAIFLEKGKASDHYDFLVSLKYAKFWEFSCSFAVHSLTFAFPYRNCIFASGKKHIIESGEDVLDKGLEFFSIRQ